MRLTNLIPTSAKLLLYKAAILPYLIYCSIVNGISVKLVIVENSIGYRRGVSGLLIVIVIHLMRHSWEGLNYFAE